MTLVSRFLLSVSLVNLCIASPAHIGQRALSLPDLSSVHKSNFTHVGTALSGNHPAVPFYSRRASDHFYWTNITFQPMETV